MAQPATAVKPANATKVVTLDDIKYNEENKVMAILSLFGIIGLIIAFIEKDDLFVKYHGFEFGFLNLALIAVIILLNIIGGFIACIGSLVLLLVDVAVLVVFIIALMKVLKGERFDMPIFSDLALKMLNR